MIEHVDVALEACLRAYLKEIEEQDRVSITYARPGEVPTGASSINLFLLGLHENVTSRAQMKEISRRPGDDLGAWRRGPIAVSLNYLITAHHADLREEHRLLSVALVGLLRQGSLFGEGLANRGIDRIELAIAQPDAASTEVARLWNALGTPLRASFGLTATLSFNPFKTEETHLVREAILATRVMPNGPGMLAHLSTRKVAVAGAVTARLSDAPVEGVEVEIVGRPEIAYTDERGFFFFEDIPPGKVQLRFKHPEYAVEEAQTIAPRTGRTDEIKPVSVTLSRIHAPLPSADWEGPLRDEVGRIAPHIPVRIGERTAVTDQSGRYRLGISPTESQPLEANWPGRGWSTIATRDQKS